MGQRSILIQYESSTEMFRSRITKQKLKGVSGCRDFCELLRCKHVRGGESRIRNRQLSIAPRNVFGPRRCWRVLNRSGNTKRGSKGVGGCRDFRKNTDLLHNGGEESRIRNRQLSIAPRNVFGPWRCWRVLNRSGNTKRGSKGVGGCWENWDLLCSRSLPPILSRLSHSQFSRQPLVAFEPRFDFSDRLNTLDCLQRQKTFRGVNPRLRLPRQVASCHAVDFLGDFRLSQQQRILFEICFVILDQFGTSKHSLESKIFCRVIRDC